MTKEHKDRVTHLIDALEEARIFSGAEFEALGNERKHEEQVIFEMVRDSLKTQINTLESYLIVKGEAE